MLLTRCALVGLVLALPARSFSDPWVETVKLLPAGYAVNGTTSHGWAVAIDGDTMVAGAPDETTGGAVPGAAYVYVRSGSTWVEQARLISGPPYTGWSVDIDGDTIVLGKFSAQTASVFERVGTTWTETALLPNPTGITTAGFGRSVAVSGDTILVGASLISEVHEFVRDGSSWTQNSILTNGGTLFEHYGEAVSLHGDLAVVGRPYQVTGGFADEGKAYVYERSGTAWTEVAELIPGNTEVKDQFGAAVDTDGTRIIVGAFFKDSPTGINRGASYVFEQVGGAWVETAELLASNAGEDFFGASVGIDGDLAVMGGPRDDLQGAQNKGSARVFVHVGGSWIEQDTLIASDAGKNDEFGHSVAICGTTIVAGAPYEGEPGFGDRGAVYVFEAQPQWTTYCTAGTSAAGCQALIGASGTPSASASSGFSLSITGIEGAKDALFFYGPSGQQAVPWGNGTSYVCVVPPRWRGGLLSGVGTAGACDGSFSQDLNARWCPTCPKPLHNPGAGAMVWGQLWYRDPASTSNMSSSMSDAIELCVGP
jgi:hypothetical protein